MSASSASTLRVLVYSDDRTVREQVLRLLGPRPSPELPKVEYIEAATEPAAVRVMDGGDIDLAILDGEAAPVGGMGMARSFKAEIYRCPPILVLTGRPQDAWLAAWSNADLAVPYPPDPFGFPEQVAGLLRQRLGTSVSS